MPQNAKKPFLPLIFTLTFLLIFSLSSCASISRQSGEKYTKTGFYLDTVVTLTVYSEEDAQFLDDCLALCGEYEKIFSRTAPESELYKLNSADSAEVSPALSELIETALEYCETSGGRFDITMGAISDMYAFSSDSPTLPSDEAITDALEHTGYEKISLEGNTITLSDAETVIDLGAIAKGYIADALADFLRSKGVESAIIDLGGNILCLGSKPDGSNFKIGIQYPYRDSNQVIDTVAISDLSLVTSGVYQRWFEHDGEIYHHILDPKTGRSLNNGLISVSIISSSSTACDGLSTTVFAMGLEDGMALINSLPDTWAVFITEDMELHYSEGFEERFGK
ncbi:MAG: FAD:protein FMN transferase [Ruminococcaceae bacterium]|nr:FAD:protein FMN transferase [Oscillospiraceae bacterium]